MATANETKKQQADNTQSKLAVSGVTVNVTDIDPTYDGETSITGIGSFTGDVYIVLAGNTLTSTEIAGQVNSLLDLSSYFPT